MMAGPPAAGWMPRGDGGSPTTAPAPERPEGSPAHGEGAIPLRRRDPAPPEVDVSSASDAPPVPGPSASAVRATPR